MRQIGLLICTESGQTRSYVFYGEGSEFPACLVWGESVVDSVEAKVDPVDAWPPESEIMCAAVINRDQRCLTLIGGDVPFVAPYQMELLEQLVTAAWQGFDVRLSTLSHQALAKAAGSSVAPIDAKLGNDFATTSGEQDDEADSDSDNQVDFRGLVVQSDSYEDELRRCIEDDDWWVSVRIEKQHVHFFGDNLLTALEEFGPSFLQQLDSFEHADPPPELECSRGLLIDVTNQTIHAWSFPLGLPEWFHFNQKQWPGWSLEVWQRNGFRRQLEHTGESESYIEMSDMACLASFVPVMTEPISFDDAMKTIKSSVRGVVWRGYGCLGMVLSVPAAIVWAITGSWKGPFLFAAILWIAAVFAVQKFLGKLKHGIKPVLDKHQQMRDNTPEFGPKSREERISRMNELLKIAGMPSYEQIDGYVDSNSEVVEPIFKSGDTR